MPSLGTNLKKLLVNCSDAIQGSWLCRNQRLRVALAERVQQVAQLRTDIQKLSHESELAARDSFEIAEYMRKELLHKEDINVRTRAALSEVWSLWLPLEGCCFACCREILRRFDSKILQLAGAATLSCRAGFCKAASCC